MEFSKSVEQMIGEICKENNFERTGAVSMTRYVNKLNNTMLLAYKVQSKGVKVFFDTTGDIANSPTLGRYADFFQSRNEVNKGSSSYFSNQVLITNVVQLNLLREIITIFIFDQSLLKKVRGTKKKREILESLVEGVKNITLNRNLKFGIELELNCPRNVDLKEMLSNAGIKVSNPRSTHSVCTGWKMVRDGSLDDEYGMDAFELVSPPLTNFDELERVCEVLNANGVKFNESCGLHVHHDISELKRQQIMRIYNFYNKYQDVIEETMPSHRVRNDYCQRISRIIDRVNECDSKNELLVRIGGKGRDGYYDNCRYYTINLRSFLYYGTIEFRQHYATSNFETIKNWILFTHKIIERGLKIGKNIEYNLVGDNKREHLDEMFKELGVENTSIHKNFEQKFKGNL